MVHDKLEDIQILRFVAAILVVINHLVKEMNDGIYSVNNEFNIILVGQAGVDLFFVISGFIMVYVTKDVSHNIRAAILFFKKRICRIVPLYWCFTVITLFVSLILPELKNENQVGAAYFFSSILFVPFQRSDGNITPLFGLGWTLNYEMFFYLIFSIALLFKRNYITYLIGGILISLFLVGQLFDVKSVLIKFWSSSIIIEFLFGYILAKIFLKGVKIKRITGVFFIFLGVFGFYLSTTINTLPTNTSIRGIVWGIPAALIFAGVVFSESSVFNFLPQKAKKLLIRFGDGSYSLYLGHMFVVRAVSILLPLAIPFGLYDYVYSSLVVLVCLVCSDLMYRYFEKPSNRLLLQLFDKKKRDAALY